MGLTFNAVYRPWYIWLVGLLLFPIGLLGVLLVRYDAPITLTFEPGDEGTLVCVVGKGPSSVRQAFEAMAFES